MQWYFVEKKNSKYNRDSFYCLDNMEFMSVV